MVPWALIRVGMRACLLQVETAPAFARPALVPAAVLPMRSVSVYKAQAWWLSHQHGLLLLCLTPQSILLALPSLKNLLRQRGPMLIIDGLFLLPSAFFCLLMI